MEDHQKDNEGFIPKHGGYRNLITYRKSSMMAPFILRIAFFENRIEPLVKWCKLQEVANKIL